MPGTRKLGRTSDHRKAMLRAMVTFLFETGKIETTATRAKEVRAMAEKMVTLGKREDLHAKRQVYGFITKESVAKKVIDEIGPKYADRDGALVMRLDSTMVGLVKLRVAALPDSLRRSAALLDKVSGMTNIMLMTGLARTLDPAADTTAFVRLESDFRADVAALTAEPVRRRLFREREAGVEVAGYYSAAPSGEAELVLVVSGGGNEARCVLGGRFGEEEALRLATMQREQLLGRGGTR